MNRSPLWVIAGLLWLPAACLAQITTERHVVSASGDQLTGGFLDLTFTLGEWTTGPLQPSGSSLTANLGFHQADLMVSDLEEWLDLGLPALYPNPFSQEIILSNPAHRTGTLQILDPQGHLVVTRQLLPQSAPETIWMGTLPAGAYIVRFSDHQHQTSSSLTILKQ
ncbi:MAG: T9SS type A sorting domain-containing protein [Saprospiraceae bacterium]